MLKLIFCDYSDAYIIVKRNIIITEAGADVVTKEVHERNKGVIVKNCAPFTDCISEINNTQVDNAKDLDVVMPMYNLLEYSDNYSKTSGSLWQYYRDEPNAAIVNYESIKYKLKITGKSHLMVIEKMLKCCATKILK